MRVSKAAADRPSPDLCASHLRRPGLVRGARLQFDIPLFLGRLGNAPSAHLGRETVDMGRPAGDQEIRRVGDACLAVVDRDDLHLTELGEASGDRLGYLPGIAVHGLESDDYVHGVLSGGRSTILGTP